jgi:hypothetical protein
MEAMVRLALEAARSQVGVREQGENRGPQVDEYLRSVGLGPGYPWCAAFVYWCIEQAARRLKQPNPFIRTAYCPTIANWARTGEILEAAPRGGDVFLVYSARARHTGFVSAVEGRLFRTVEGNTNLEGSPEGIGVFERVRQIGPRYRFVRWGRLVGPETSASYRLVLKRRPLWELPVRGGRALCPVRAWAECLGIGVDWKGAEQAVVLDGRELDADVVLIEGRAHAPIRALAEAAGLPVIVDTVRRIVSVG